MPQVQIIEPIRQQQTARLRVCAYARVSSDSEDQQHSFAAQVRYYTTLIASHEDWEFVDIYADEGITGTCADKREDFQRMMQDCRDGKIDRILVKSLSRFARNTQDCIAAVRELKQLGVTVVFEKEHLNTGTMANEMFLSMMSAFAQEESISISQNMRKGARMRMENGTYRTTSLPYGYDLSPSGSIEINPTAAATVQSIFTSYLGGMGIHRIAKHLERQGIPNPHGKASWNANTILYMLQNEWYIGDARLGKRVTTDTLPFRRTRNTDCSKQFYLNDTHKGIIPKSDFDKVQSLLKGNQQHFGRPRTYQKTPFTGKLLCSCCQSTLTRRVKAGRVDWGCPIHNKKGRSSCPMKNVSESELCNAVTALQEKLSANKEEILGTYLSQLEKIRTRQYMTNQQYLSIYHTIAKLQRQNHTLNDLYRKQSVDSAFYYSQTNLIQRQLDQLRQQQAKYRNHSETSTLIQSTCNMMSALEQETSSWFSQSVVSVTVFPQKFVFAMSNGLQFHEDRSDRT